MFACPVLAVVDGDTITVQTTSELMEWSGLLLPKKQKIRLFGVDAPEMKQGTHGRLTREYTAAAIASCSTCVVIPKTIDIYKRVVGEIILGELNLSLELLSAGRAIAYRAYLGPKGEVRTRYLSTEAAAKEAGLGVWADPEFVPPTVWRKRSKVV
jgi:micrococcal nuclease